MRAKRQGSPADASAPSRSRKLKSLANDVLKQIRRAKRIYIIGNGGSYANAQHICNDLLACGKRAFTLDPATLTASANDHGYQTVFARWIRTVGERGDLLLALSGSGTSANIVSALRAARAKGIDTALITWRLKGGMDMQLSEEAQITLGHYWMKKLRGRKRTR